MNAPLPLALDDIVRSIVAPIPKKPLNRRNAVYFPPGQCLELVDAKLFNSAVIDDDYSTWEFNAPVALSSWGSESDASTCVSPCHSPAQDIAFRYRAGLKVDLGEEGSSSSSSSSSGKTSSGQNTRFTTPQPSLFEGDTDFGEDTSSFISSGSSEMSMPPFPVVFTIAPKYRESRINALMDIHQEALAMIKSDGLERHQPVVCHRPDCRDTLPNLKALVYHLHIHNISDRGFRCDGCRKGYESRRELAMHACRSRVTSAPCSPIRDTFMRVLTKITSRE